jgi:hypothetical protein
MSTSEMQIFVSRSPGQRVGVVVVAWAGAVVLGLGIGVLTSFGQGWLTGTSNAFVNSESAWLVAPFAVGALCRRPVTAAWLGLLACVMQLVGYELCSQLRYGAMAWSVELGWGVAALGGGPLFGLAGRLWRFGRPAWRGLGPAALAAAFMTEGGWQYLHELHRVLAGVLWLGIGAAVALAGMRRARDWAWLPVTVAAGLLVQLAVTHVYG